MTNWISANATIQANWRRDRARRITEALWKTGEEYHAGVINERTWKSHNERLWREAEADGVASEVTRQLRNGR